MPSSTSNSEDGSGTGHSKAPQSSSTGGSFSFKKAFGIKKGKKKNPFGAGKRASSAASTAVSGGSHNAPGGVVHSSSSSVVSGASSTGGASNLDGSQRSSARSVDGQIMYHPAGPGGLQPIAEKTQRAQSQDNVDEPLKKSQPQRSGQLQQQPESVHTTTSKYVDETKPDNSMFTYPNYENIDDNDEEKLRDPTPSKEHVDNSFLDALRKGADRSSQSSSVADASTLTDLAEAELPRERTDDTADTAFLKALQGARIDEDFGDDAVKGRGREAKYDEISSSNFSSTTAQTTTVSRVASRISKVQPPISTNRAKLVTSGPGPDERVIANTLAEANTNVRTVEALGDEGLNAAVDADSAFLRALRAAAGDPESSNARNKSSAPSPQPDPRVDVEQRNNADISFLKALRGDVDAADEAEGTKSGVATESNYGAGRAVGGSKGRGKVAPPVSTNRASRAIPTSKSESPAVDAATDGDSAFLKALRDEDSNTGALGNGSAAQRQPTRKIYSETEKSNDSDSAFLKALRGDTDETVALSETPQPAIEAKSAKLGGMSDADVDFLAAMRGAIQNPSSYPSSTTSGNRHGLDADASFSLNDNDSGARVNYGGSFVVTSKQSQKRNTAKAVAVPAMTNTTTSKNTPNKPNEEMVYANAAFLGALHASTDTPDDIQGGNARNQPADGSFILNSRPKPWQNQSGNPDAEFLMAIHGPQASRGTDQFERSYSSGINDSGTLVLNSPDERGVGAKKNNLEDSKTAFLMAIHSSTDDRDSTTNDKNARLDGATNGSEDDVVAMETDEDDDDDDTEDLKVPSQPFLEKVFLPRPLFFGHILPPRIIEAAEHVASIHASEFIPAAETLSIGIDSGVQENKSVIPLDRLIKHVEPSQIHPLRSTHANQSFGAPPSSKPNTSSFGLLGGKKVDSHLSPCYRNLEGALETFGFGVNPLSFEQETSQEDGISTTKPNAPHPYVALYSPVWHDWSRTSRAKAKRRRDKLEGKANVVKSQSFPMTDDSKCQASSSSPISSNSRHLLTDVPIRLDPYHAAKRDQVAVTSTTSAVATEKNGGLLSDNSQFSQDLFSHYARAESESVTSNIGGSDRDSFLGNLQSNDNVCGTFISTPSIMPSVTPSQFDSSTFVQAVKGTNGGGDGDDDSINAAEERKTVGWNDNISAAAAMLAGRGVGDDDGDENVRGGICSSTIMARGGGEKAANKHGRPYSNLELTNGCVPLFGCDDPSLPHESDMGVFETKEEEKRSVERRREKDIIEDLAVPGIMAHVTCPTNCSDVDDSQTWNSRAAATEPGNRNRSNTNTILISLDGNSTSDVERNTNELNKSPVFETSRIGWWNLPNGPNHTSRPLRLSKRKNRNYPPSVEVFPAFDDPIPLDVQTNLWPPAQLLRENNFDKSKLHSATSTARYLPYLSDRPPSVRHLQIDTTAVGFPKLGGEIEPMFCKLAIYHFEMNSEKSPNGFSVKDGESVSTGMSSVPSPNMDRCGRVTEALSFDVVQDSLVVENCKRALWPYAGESEIAGHERELRGSNLEGTPCGVFPLPANLNISNLFAVITVHKVLSDPSDLQPYFKSSRREGRDPKSKHEDIDLDKLRKNAGKASEQFGKFITPFAFGVVPLMHIIGNEAPKVPVSRAVQIPLFKFVSGRGSQSILDHILVMLYPRAESSVGKAASMTRGHALLVMRYFGFLGLHSIIEKKSSLARDRLVDFTGELQVKRNESEVEGGKNAKVKCPILGENYILPPWHPEFVVEPTKSGGRNNPKHHAQGVSDGRELPTNMYAQEIVSLPLERFGSNDDANRGRSRSSRLDHVVIHTSFCNELICQPTILRKCSKKNIVIKVELREIQWSESLKVDVAVPVEPSIHNTRRGPWLVREAFSSCALGASEPQFLDEFKIKLPLILGEPGHEKVGLFFSVYHVKVKKKKSTCLRAMSKRRESDSTEDYHDTIEHLGSGFLQLTQDGSPTCLLANGDHEVPINLRTIQLVDTADGTSLDLPSPPVGKHRKSSSFSSAIGRHVRSWSGSISNASDDVIKTTLSNENIEESCETNEFEPRLVKYPRGTLALGRILGRLSPRNRSAEFVTDTGEDSDWSEDSMKSDSGMSRAILSEKVRRATIAGKPPESDLRPVLSSGNLDTLDSSSSTSPASEPFKDNMILQVNVVAFTSVHPQNRTLADFFKLKPKVPRGVTSADFSETYSPWGKHRSEILYRIKPERIPPFYFVGGVLAEIERKMLEPVLGLSKSSKCSHAELLPHLLRVVSQLWRTMVAGTGEPSILWASPESLIPLRLNAFATLLHTISSASYHMSKSERQLDGSTKWNLNALGKMLVMLFDESSLLPGPLEDYPERNSEKVVPKSNEVKLPSRPPINKPSILSNRSKTTTHVKPTLCAEKPAIVARFSSDESRTNFDVDAMLKSSKKYQMQIESSTEKMDEDFNDKKGMSSMTSGAAGFRVDSKNDFMSNLAKTSFDSEADSSFGRNAKKSGDALLNAFVSPVSNFGPAANKRRWMTLPSNALATIQENDADDGRQKPTSPNETAERGDALDAELILREKKDKPTQFRVPQVGPSKESKQMKSFLDDYSLPLKKEPGLKEEKELFVFDDKKRSLPKNNDEIESAGTAFLDQISKSIGLTHGAREMGAEEKRVGSAHHRKTRSRCSIDWSLPPTDKLLEKDQQMEQFNRNRAGNGAQQAQSPSPVSAFPGDGNCDNDVVGNEGVDKVNLKKVDSSSAIRDGNTDHPLKRQYQSTQGLSSDKSDSINYISLPDFADRMSAMRDDSKPKRWWPYVYEVVIYQWLALLIEQTKKGESASNKSGGAKQGSSTTSGLSPIVVKYLSHAAKAARGATIRCAPYLLEIIKQSLSWRIDSISRRGKDNYNQDGNSSPEGVTTNLVKLDENVLAALEKLITMLTDASIDSRNFDSFEFRKISIDVNDAVVRFVRDLFSMLDVKSVHRLILVYFSRFVVKEGKHWHDRDSKSTGLRCSWETTKLRLNAVTLVVRFPEFMKVNIPLMDSWKAWPDGSSVGSTRHFFTVALDKINDLGLSEFSASEGPVRKEPLEIPKLKPHWLAELCTDICLSATGHAEQNIQHRSSSLLFELFWRISQQGRAKGIISVGASVFVPFIPKLLGHINYLSSLPAKCQLRKDIIPCALLVLQSAPVGLMRALWRKLSKRAEDKTSRRDSAERYGGIVSSGSGLCDNLTAPFGLKSTDDDIEMESEPDIYDMFCLLNLSLATMEYEGNYVRLVDNIGEVIDNEEYPSWRKEFLLSEDRDQQRTAIDRIRFPNQRHGATDSDVVDRLSTCNSRRWHAHDSSIVIIHTCRDIVRETLGLLRPSIEIDGNSEQDGGSLEISASRSLSDCFLQRSSFDSSTCDNSGQLHEEKKQSRLERRLNRKKAVTLAFSVTDTIIFVRAATSVYLHALTMKQSDIGIVKTLTAAVEIVKIFGIKVFLAAVGETLQHWMRVLLEHCGARRAEIRVDASEFLNLLLRLTWDSYGSFFRVRLPLLAVQTEVMDRIVATAATKYVTEQRRLDLSPVLLSNDAAEASLTPLWRTIHRLQNQSVSRNLSFKSALARLAIMMKKLFKAYLAAHALTIVNRSETSGNHVGDAVPSQVNPYVQRMRVSVHRIVSNAAGFSKQFLGNQVSASLDRSSIQTEAVEDAFLSAADVFSSTELPFHRVEWLQMLAEFHKMRGRFAEEATCRCNIYHTYREAAKQHEHIWSSSPFLPWASNSSDGTHHDGEALGGGAIFADYGYEIDNLSVGSGKNFDRSTSVRRIFHRAADSVRVRTGDWGVVGGGRYLFYGVTLKSEFDTVSPWYSLRDMEEYMVKEAETCGDLYLRAGIVESSRYCWSLVTQFYSETFNYGRLANVYRKLALVVTSQIPVIDKSSQIDLTSPIGRFYKVYFHGGAPDDLNGIEFVYRAPNSVQIKDFGSRLESAVRSILPSKSTIDLVLDDGSPTMVPKTAGNKRPAVIGGAPIEPIKIKVTPLRPLFKMEDRDKCFRGTPEWFQLKAEEYEYASIDYGISGMVRNIPLHHRHQSLSTTNTFGSIGSVTMPSRRSSSLSKFRSFAMTQNFHNDYDKGSNGELVGVDRFYFTQPQRKDPLRGFRDWLKVPKGRFAERSLRVTELQVENCFPACVTRQKVIHRAVFTQSPLEASVEAVSTWCSVLFRTVIATNGQSVLVGQRDQGLSANAAKVVADCIHSSGVKQIGLSFLVVNTRSDESNNDGSIMYDSSKTLLSEEEVEKVQAKLARIILIFLEMLHLLIARNRDVLLAVVQARKRKGGDISSMASASGSVHGGYAATSRTGSNYSPIKGHIDRQSNDSYYYERQNGDGIGKSFGSDNPMNYGHHVSNSSDRTDAAIGVQSELQRGFIGLVKALSPNIMDTINSEVPRWLRQCCQENYFSSGRYRQAKIPIADELFLNVDATSEREGKADSSYNEVPRSIIDRSSSGGQSQRGSSPNGSLCGTETSESKRMERSISINSDRLIQDRSHHRRTPSGASHASSQRVAI